MRRPLAPAVSAFAAVVLLAACGDQGPQPAEPQVIGDTQFAAGLNVDLDRMTVTAEGIYYEDLTTGEGTAAAAGDAVVVGYTLWLSNGTQIDQGTIATLNGAPFVLGSGQVVPGFDFGIRGMRPGGSRLVLVPPALGYGLFDNGRIPGGSILVFRIDLISVD